MTQPLATTDGVTGEVTSDVLQMDPQQSWRSAVALAATNARNALPHSHGRLDKAIELVLTDKVELLDNGHALVQSQQKDGVTAYEIINGTCPCPDYERAPEHQCKHRLARGLAIRARQIAKAMSKTATTCPIGPDDLVPDPQTVEHDVPTGAPGAPALDQAPVTIPERFLVEIQGRQFVTFHGLLALAHQQGLVSLTARFLSVTGELALAEATAIFADGRTFTDAADSMPTNVNSRIKPHFPRIALTRAKARALRDALNLDLVAVEEVE